MVITIQPVVASACWASRWSFCQVPVAVPTFPPSPSGPPPSLFPTSTTQLPADFPLSMSALSRVLVLYFLILA